MSVHGPPAAPPPLAFGVVLVVGTVERWGVVGLGGPGGNLKDVVGTEGEPVKTGIACWIWRRSLPFNCG